MTGSSVGGDLREWSHWHRVIPALGVLLVVGAVGKSVTELGRPNGLLEAGLDLILLSVPGLVMLYVGLWLPRSSIDARYYPRIVGWIAGSILVMAVVLGLRVVHPGVDVDFTFGTQAVLLSIGSIAGLAIGVNKAQALTHARTLEERNAALVRAERQLEEANAQLEDANTQLEDSNERLEQFAYAASHDLQEPLRMVTSYLQLAERRYGDEFDDECQEYIDFAVDGAERMQEMITGLLEYSRVETQGDTFDAVDLEAVLDDVLTDHQFRIEDTDATITREPLPTVEGDYRQLQQVFQNLLSNAIQYSGDAPPEIHVAATQDDDEWRLSVSDEGIGIDADDTDRIFDVFQRLHSVEDNAGSGIGLALSKRIVDRHDGEISVDSEPGDGSTFSFTLPAHAGSTAPDTDSRPAGSSADADRERRATVAEPAGSPVDID